MSWISLLLPLHLVAIVLWVGGMLFAHMMLRPVAAAQLEPPLRLRLWVGVFGRFFPWVWLCVIAVLGTGLGMMFGYYAGFSAPLYVHAMFGLGIVMMLIFMHVFFALYAGLRRAVEAGDWPAGAQQLARIRRLVGVNMSIGVLNVVIATAGRYLVG